MQHGGFTRMPTTSCGKWFDIQPFVIRAKVSPEVPRSMLWWRSRWRCFVPFPKIHTSLMFSGFLKDSIKYFFHPLPQETPLGDTNIMQKWWGKRNVWLEIWCNSYTYFLCHFGIHSSDFPGSMMVSFRFTQFTKTSLLFGKQDTLGLWKNTEKSLSEFCVACREGVAGAPWLSWNSLNYFGGMAAFFLGVQTSLIWQNMFVWNDAGRWWIFFFGGMSGNS